MGTSLRFVWWKRLLKYRQQYLRPLTAVKAEIMDSQRFERKPIWMPNQDSGKKIKSFMKFIENKYRIKFKNYWEFHKWTVDNLCQFWADLWNFSGVICSKTYDKVMDTSAKMENRPKWFEGAKVNFGENMLKFRDEHAALIAAGEHGNVEHVTYKKLYEESKLYAAAFRKLGLKKGDVVSCYMSNRKEPVISMIAVTSIGAIWTGGVPLLGSQGYLAGVKQVAPKFLLTIDQFPYNKETRNLLQNIKEIAEGLPSLEKVIIVPSNADLKRENICQIKNSCFLDEFLQLGYNEDGTVPELVFEQVSFSHPVFISYTSGTTGKPKCIVHGFGGLLPSVRDYWIHCDTDRNDIWLSMSPVGWISWNMINHLLFVGETIFLFEGVPHFLSPTYFWDMVEEHQITAMFTTPSTLDEIEATGYLPNKSHNLNSLKVILCGSSVVKPHNYIFGLKKLREGVMFNVGYGSTETMGLISICDNTLPLYCGEINSPCLGVGIEVLDETGKPLVGEIGEFVITTPMPSSPLGFWGDMDGTLYKNTYFTKYPGKFALGDSATINPFTKGMIMCGRSDATLNPKGCRFGSSEIYDVVEFFPEIRDCLCVAKYNKDKDETVVLFLKMQDGYRFNEDIVKKVEERIEKQLSFEHVPGVILETPDIPYNVNGKKMEIIIKKIINNMPHNTEMVKNPECLNFYYNVNLHFQ